MQLTITNARGCSETKTIKILVSSSKDIEYFVKWALDNYEISKEKLNFILFSIWLSLTSYIINDPAAVIASYSKAMIRSKKFLI